MQDDNNKHWNFPTCKLCSYRSKSSFVMSKHENLHQTRLKTDFFICHSRPPEFYSCELCGFKTKLKVDLIEHFRVFHKEKEAKNILKCYHCKNCGFETHSVLVLTNHTDDCCFHKQNEQYELFQEVKPENPHKRVCINAIVLLEHSYSRSLNQYIIESEQRKGKGILKHFPTNRAKYKWNLRPHISSKYADSIKDTSWFGCLQCGFKSKYKNSLKQHTLVKHTDTNWLKCEQCGFQTKYNGNLKYHILVKHTDKNWLKCEQCGFKTIYNSNLKYHILVKHPNTSSTEVDLKHHTKWFQCEQCEYKCKQKNNLRHHITVRHADTNLLKCEQCDFKCKHKLYLKRHIKSKHLNPAFIKWFQCDQCEYKCKQKNNLKSHILFKHVNPKDINWLKCGQCNYKCMYKCHLKRHLLTKHIKLTNKHQKKKLS